jgi:hypothetical protein
VVWAGNVTSLWGCDETKQQAKTSRQGTAARDKQSQKRGSRAANVGENPNHREDFEGLSYRAISVKSGKREKCDER